MASVTAPAKNTAWRYDADGQRVSKADGVGTTVYIGDVVREPAMAKAGVQRVDVIKLWLHWSEDIQYGTLLISASTRPGS